MPATLRTVAAAVATVVMLAGGGCTNTTDTATSTDTGTADTGTGTGTDVPDTTAGQNRPETGTGTRPDTPDGPDGSVEAWAHDVCGAAATAAATFEDALTVALTTGSDDPNDPDLIRNFAVAVLDGLSASIDALATGPDVTGPLGTKIETLTAAAENVGSDIGAVRDLLETTGDATIETVANDAFETTVADIINNPDLAAAVAAATAEPTFNAAVDANADCGAFADIGLLDLVGDTYTT